MSNTRKRTYSGERQKTGENLQRVQQLKQVFDTCLQQPYSEIQAIRKSPKFKQTNRPWNEHYFNSRRSIGALVYLYKQGNCHSVATFQQYYLQTGTLLEKNPQLDPYYQGRTLEKLTKLAHRFHQVLGKNYSFEDACFYVWIRLFFETHEGVQREQRALKRYQETHPQLEVIPSEVEKDFKYAVDAEVFEAGVLIYALQVKSVYYIKDQQAILKETKQYNHRKHQAYQQRYGVPVYYLIVDKKGEKSSLIETTKTGKK